jgi:hypothetical protein
MSPPTTTSLGLRFVGADARAAGEGLYPLPGKVNYFSGNDESQWRTGIPTYARVGFRAIYPGIDLTYYGDHPTAEIRPDGRSRCEPRRNDHRAAGACARLYGSRRPMYPQNHVLANEIRIAPRRSQFFEVPSRELSGEKAYYRKDCLCFGAGSPRHAERREFRFGGGPFEEGFRAIPRCKLEQTCGGVLRARPQRQFSAVEIGFADLTSNVLAEVRRLLEIPRCSALVVRPAVCLASAQQRCAQGPAVSIR